MVSAVTCPGCSRRYRPVRRFADTPTVKPLPAKPAASGEVALAGADGRQAMRSLSAASNDAAAALARLARPAVERLLRGGSGPFFDASELDQLAAQLAATAATAELVGRARVRLQHQMAGTRQFAVSPRATFLPVPLAVLTPIAALESFTQSVPTIDVGDALEWAARKARDAMKAAIDIGKTLLRRIKKAVGSWFRRQPAAEGDAAVPRTPAPVPEPSVEEILDEAGVGPKDNSYSQIVFEINTHESFIQGGEEEVRSPDLEGEFPAWRWSAVVRPTSRPHHAARHGKVYPISTTFIGLRGTSISQIANCLCVPLYLSVHEVRQLKPSGVAFADFDPSKHPRGQPENKGEFGPGGGGQSAGSASMPSAARDVTRSAAFKKWFGDWESDAGSASKVVDDYSGEPKENYQIRRVFHGTQDEFNSFDPEKKGIHGSVAGHGFYFAEDRRVAESYAQGGGKLLEMYLNIRQPFDFDDSYGRSTINKLIDTCIQQSPNLDPGNTRRELQGAFGSAMQTDGSISGFGAHRAIASLMGKERVNEILAAAGYDGVTHQSRDVAGSPRMRSSQEDYGRIWVAFLPTQIKSVSNRGTFDAGNPNIHFADDPSKHPHAPAGSRTGGQFTTTGGSHPPVKTEAIKAAVRTGATQAKGRLQAITATAKARVHALIAKVPESVKAPFLNAYRATHASLMSVNNSARALATASAREAGMSPAHVERLGRILSAVDLAVPGALGAGLAATGHVVAGKLAAYVPVGSMGYIMYSASRHPEATLRAAGKMLSQTAPGQIHGAWQFALGAVAHPLTRQAVHAHADSANDSVARQIAERFRDLDEAGGDWYEALFMIALDETGSVDDAFVMADEAMDRRHAFADYDASKHPHKGAGSRDGGQFAPKGGGGSSGGSSPAASDKAKFIGQTVGKAEHVEAARVAARVAQMVGGQTEENVASPGQKDKKPFDVRTMIGGKVHDVEVKSLLKGGKQSLSVHEDALLRKVEHIQANPGNVFHTVAVDRRNEYSGGEFSENYSGHQVYYKRGSGRYALSKMYPVKNAAELKRLLALPENKLPLAARGHLPPPPPLAELRASAAKASQSRKAKDAAHKAANRDVLNAQARARAAAKKRAGSHGLQSR